MSVDVMMGKAFLEYEAYRACVTREGLTCGAMLDSIAEMQCNTLCARHGRGVPELLSHEHGSALFPVSACALTHDLMLPYTSAAGRGHIAVWGRCFERDPFSIPRQFVLLGNALCCYSWHRNEVRVLVSQRAWGIVTKTSSRPQENIILGCMRFVLE